MIDKDIVPTILVTGSSKGLGRYIVECLLNKGCKVIGCSRGSIDLQHDNYQHFICDITDEKAILNMFDRIKKEVKYLSAVINNAGCASMNHSLLTPYSVLENLFKINVFGVFLISREAAKLMRGKSGSIINFTTVAVPLSLAGESVYVASKSAVEALTKTLAREFIDFDITVNAVGPSPIKTDLTRTIPEKNINKLLDSMPIKKWAEPMDVWNIVDFFLSPNSRMITGQIIYLGGL